MKGMVLGVDGDAAVIVAADGTRYRFSPAEWKGAGAVHPGQPVDFVGSDGVARDVFPDHRIDDDDPPVEGTPSNGSFIGRLRSLMTQPRVEWQAIAFEDISAGRLIGETALLAGVATLVVGLQIAAFLALIFAALPDDAGNPAPPLAMLLAFAIGAPVAMIVIGTLSSILRVLMEALVARFAAPGFDGRGDYRSALKLATFAATPIWLATMVPVFGIFLQWVGLIYSIYLLYAGSGPVLGVPRAKRGIFTGIVVVGTWVAQMAVFFILYIGFYVVVFATFGLIAGGTALGGVPGH